MTASSYISQSDSALTASINWINGVLLGSVAVSLCVMAVAIVGLMMLSGRLPVRDGIRVVLGCFVLLGAPIIAAGLAGVWMSEEPGDLPPPELVFYADGGLDHPAPRESRPSSAFDPYAGASLRRD